MTLPPIFPLPRHITPSDGVTALNGGITAPPDCAEDARAFLHILRRSDFHCGEGNLTLKRDSSLNTDTYRILCGKDGVTVRASGRRGFVFAAATLSQLIRPDRTLPCLTVSDAPYLPLRGAHFYLPPKDGIDAFCRILDALAYLKYNTVFLEIGGGVEYRSHPELADAWRRFCREARNYPGGPQGLQGSQIWWKDSTHIELAGGDVLSRDQLMRIVSHARFLGMEVIPEIQALSHSYYLTLAHPEIAEIPYETYPDTCCPLNEESYRIYTDIATELHSLIGFDRVSIGHDEIRILGVCPKCRTHSGAELLATEINRLHGIYEKLGVRLFMWGESLQNFALPGGKRMGDAIVKDGCYGRHYEKPACFGAIDRIPRDITMLDWCYTSSFRSEQEFADRGFSEIYGNFHGTTVTGWEKRSRRPNVTGAEVSTWCVADENEIGRNGWFFEFAFSAAVLWRTDFCDAVRDEWMSDTNRMMPMLRATVRGLPTPIPQKEQTLLTPAGSVILDGTESLGTRLSVPFCGEDSHVTVPVGRCCAGITLLQAADLNGTAAFPRVYTWFFRDPAPRILGFCTLIWEDGIAQAYPMEYGVVTGDLHGGFGTDLPSGFVKNVEDESDTEDEIPASDFQPTAVIPRDEWIDALAYFTDVIPLPDSDTGTRTVYGWTLPNPRPEIPVREIRIYPERHAEGGKTPIRLFGVLI